MFRRLPVNFPADPSYPADLEKLDYHLTDHGTFEKISQPGEFFKFFITDNERANVVHREAAYTCVREIVLQQLEGLGVKRLYLNGEGGATINDAKPDNAHVAILTTERKELKDKKEVLLVIGEHTQDLGIWTYRSLMREGGLDAGSAVGLVKSLQQKHSHDSTMDGGVAVNGSSSSSEQKGIIILNMGQLNYSPQLNSTMTQVTWLARPKQSAVHDPYHIHPLYNLVEGHRSPEQHLKTCVERILPQLIDKDAKVRLVGVRERWTDDPTEAVEFEEPQTMKEVVDFFRGYGTESLMVLDGFVDCDVSGEI